VRSQYKETIFLVAARYRGEEIAYCPFIWVDQDMSLMRGLVQGWPKQIGSTWIIRSYDALGKASSPHAPGGRFGASLAAKDRRLADARVTLCETSERLPRPSFAAAVNVRLFPNLARTLVGRPALRELVRLKSRDVQVGPIMKGEANLELHDHPRLELVLLRPRRVGLGYRFAFALMVDDLETLEDLQAPTAADPYLWSISMFCFAPPLAMAIMMPTPARITTPITIQVVSMFCRMPSFQRAARTPPMNKANPKKYIPAHFIAPPVSRLASSMRTATSRPAF